MGKDLEQTMKFKADISDLQRGIEKANTAIKLATSEYKAAGDGTKTWAAGINGLTAKQKQLESILDSQKAKLAAYSDHLEKNADYYAENTAEADKLKTEMNNLQGGINRTEAELKDVTKALEDSSQEMYDLGQAAEDANIKLEHGLGDAVGFVVKSLAALASAALAAGVAVAGIAISKGFERLENIDTAKAKLYALKLTTNEVDSAMESALESVRGTAFAMGDAATAAGMAKAAGVQLGDSMTNHLSRIANVAAIAGRGMDDMSSIINKVQTQGKVTGNELKQLGDAGIPVIQWLAEEMGVATEKVRKLASDGKISAETLYSAIDKNVGGAAKKMGELSIAAAKDNFFAALSRAGASFLSTAGKYGSFFDMFKKGIGDATGMVDKLEPLAKAAGSALMDMVGPLVQQGMAKIKDLIANMDFEMLAYKISAAGKVIGQVFSTLWSIGKEVFSLIANLVKALAQDLLSLGSNLKGGVAGGFNTLQKAIQTLNKHMNVLVPLTKALIAAWMGYKTLQFASKVIGSINTAMKLSNAIYLVTIGLKKQYAAALTKEATKEVDVTAKKAAHTLAQYGLNASLLACPLTWFTALVVAVVAAIAIFSTRTRELTADQKKLVDETNKTSDATREYIQSCKEASEAFKTNIENIDANAVATTNLVDRLAGLMDGTIEVKDKHAEMDATIGLLNSSMDGLNLRYDAETGKIIDVNTNQAISIGQIKELIAEKIKLAKTEAWSAEYNRLVQEGVRLEKEQAKNAEVLEGWKKTIADLDAKGLTLTKEQSEAYNAAVKDAYSLQQQRIDNANEARDAEARYKEELNKTNDEIMMATRKVEDFQGQTSRSGESFEDFARRVGVSSQELTTAVNSSGKEFDVFAEAIDEAMKSGDLSFADAVVQYNKHLAQMKADTDAKGGDIVSSLGSISSDGIEAMTTAWVVDQNGFIKEVEITADGMYEEFAVLNKPGSNKYIPAIIKTSLDGSRQEIVSYRDPMTGEVKLMTDDMRAEFEQLNKITNIANTSFDGVKKELEAATPQLKTQSTIAKDGVINELKKLEPEAKPIGANFIFGVGGGIDSQTGPLYKKIDIVGSTIMATFRKSLQEGSPSKLAIRSGKNIMLGIMVGLESLKKQVLQTSAGIADGLMDSLDLSLSDPLKANLSGQMESMEIVSKADTKLIDALDKLTRKLGDGFHEGDNVNISINGVNIGNRDTEFEKAFGVVADKLMLLYRMGRFAL